MKLSDIKDLVIVAAIAYAIYWIYSNREKFDPTSANNVVNKGADATVQAISNGKYPSVGAWLYGVFGDDTLDPIRFSPYILPDGSKGMRVTRVVRLRDDMVFDVDWSGLYPTLVRVAS